MALKALHEGHVPVAPVPAGIELAALAVGDAVVARYWDGSGLPATLAPRPFLHPVTTLAGTEVTDAQPDDHRWHLGVSVALQDVGGTNLWGGRTYRRDAGYTWLPDHGRQAHVAWQALDRSGFDEQLQWLDHAGAPLLLERRRVRTRAADLPGAWLLELSSALTNTTHRPLALGSPATHGRAGAGYGGLFWRLPLDGGDGRVFTSSTEGETAVHGSRAAWVAWSRDGAAPCTVVLAGLDEPTRQDPWFVRMSDYPGLGSQLAAEEPVRLAAGTTTRRHFLALVADGVLDEAAVEAGLAPPAPAAPS